MVRRLLLALMLSPFFVQASGVVTLGWNPSPDPLIASYNIYYGGSSGIYTNKLAVGNAATNITISGLVGGQTYYFAATAIDATGLETAYSSEVACLIPTRSVMYLALNRSNGVPVSVSVTVSGMIPVPWTLQTSTNLVGWTTLAQGTNLPVNFLVPVGQLACRFFRLLGP